MRVKEFVIFILIFTVLYTIFFLLYDKISGARDKKRLINNAKSLIDIEKFNKFCLFYGIQSNVSLDLIINIYLDYFVDKNCYLSLAAANYGINSLEFVVIILYLEYVGLIHNKKFSLTDNYMKNMDYNDQCLVKKYDELIKEQKTYEMITSSMSGPVNDDLNNIESYFLIPGVRVVDSNIYYVGDYL